MKFQDSSFNGLKVTVGTKCVTHARTHPLSKSNMPHQLFQSWGHKNFIPIGLLVAEIFMFESVNRRTDGRTDTLTHRRRLDWYTIPSAQVS